MKSLLDIMAKLRDPEGGCPWDLEQDFASITKHTIEEAYEVVDAIEKQDMAALKEELGDLLLQVVFYAQMAKEEQLFNFDDVVASITEKLITRHPHIFAEAEIRTADEQSEFWEAQKAKERQEKAHGSVLDGVALALPALTRAEKLQKRAARVGFDWPDIEGAFDKVEEEVEEIKQVLDPPDSDKLKEEIGDLLFAVTNVARKAGIDTEEALKQANHKFIKRFTFIEKTLAEKGRHTEEATLAEMDELWEKAKRIKV